MRQSPAGRVHVPQQFVPPGHTEPNRDLTGQVGDLSQYSASQWGWVLLTGLLLTGYVATWYCALARAQASQALRQQTGWDAIEAADIDVVGNRVTVTVQTHVDFTLLGIFVHELRTLIDPLEGPKTNGRSTSPTRNSDISAA